MTPMNDALLDYERLYKELKEATGQPSHGSALSWIGRSINNIRSLTARVSQFEKQEVSWKGSKELLYADLDVAWKKVGDLRESLAKVNSELNAAPQIEVAYHELLEACRKGCHGDALRWINEHSDNERFDR